VIPAYKILEQLPLLPIFYKLDIQGGKLLHAPCKRTVDFPISSGCNALLGFDHTGRLLGRKRQYPLLLQQFQQTSALQASESATSSFPVQQFAYSMGKLRSADSCTGLHNLLDQGYLFDRKLSTAETLLIFCCVHTIFLSLLYNSERLAPSPAKNHWFQKYFSPLYRIAVVLKSTKKKDILIRRNDKPLILAYNQLLKIGKHLLLMLFRGVVKEPHPSRIDDHEVGL
jgi:hypothetical protein